ncbi:hypothetical protein Gotur_016946, partial [Gossypium turneri]
RSCAVPGSLHFRFFTKVLDDIDFAPILRWKRVPIAAPMKLDVANRASTQFSCDVYSHRQV